MFGDRKRRQSQVSRGLNGIRERLLGRRAGSAVPELSFQPLERRILLSGLEPTYFISQRSGLGGDYLVVEHLMTEEEFEELKACVGTAIPGVDYNVIVDGHGTGLKPPTAEEWEEMAGKLLVTDSITLVGDKLLAPPSVDWSTSQYFPPIGNQDGEGSCTCWSMGYYIKTFQEAMEHGWDLSGAAWEGGYTGHPSAAYQDKIFSPDFLYHQTNEGYDGGSSGTWVQNVIAGIGAATWDTMPYDPADSTSWPLEAAWREAALYRGQGGVHWINTSKVDTLKDLLAAGNLAKISVDADDMYEMATLDNFLNAGVNHGVTVVGYDDTWSYTEEGGTRYGAFKVANSWGDDWGYGGGGDGCWWLSYEALDQRVSSIQYIDDMTGYNPEVVAVFDIDHPVRGDTSVLLGTGSTGAPTDLKTFISPGRSCDGDDAYPDGNVVIDITELTTSLPASTNFFIRVTDSGSVNTGTISSFSIEYYSDYLTGTLIASGTSPDTPVATVQGGTVYAEVWLDTEAVTVDLQAGSDTGVSDTDNYTADSTPTFDVTVTRAGRIDLDYDGDSVVDATQDVGGAGTYPFTPSAPLSDGLYPVNVTFTDTSSNVDTDSDPTTIDTTEPEVDDVWVSSTHGSWALGDVLFGSSDLATGVVPWTRVNQTGFRFSEDVYLGADPMSFSASLREGTLDPGTAAQPNQDEVVWTWSDPDGGLGGYLDRNWIKIKLDASKVTDLAGNMMDTDHLQNVKVMPGDVDGNTAVLSTDRLDQLSSLGKISGMPGYDARADVNGDGFVLSADRLSLLNYLGQMVPSQPSDPSGETLLGALPNEDFSVVKSHPTLLREISVQLQRKNQESMTRLWSSLLNRNAGTTTRS